MPHPDGRPSAAQNVYPASLSWRDSSTDSRHIILIYGAFVARNTAILDQELATERRPQNTMTASVCLSMVSLSADLLRAKNTMKNTIDDAEDTVD